MKRISLLAGSAIGFLTGLPVIALLYLGQRLAGLPFVPFDLFDWLVRVLPGPLVTFGIDSLVRVVRGLNLGATAAVAKQVEQAMALVIFLLLWAAFGLALAALSRRWPGRLADLGSTGGLLWVLAALLLSGSLISGGSALLPNLFWLALVFVGGGYLLARTLLAAGRVPAAEGAVPAAGELSRRRFLYLVGVGSFAVVVTALGLRLLEQDEEAAGPPQALPDTGSTSGPAESPPQDALAARFEPVPGTRPELTPTGKFYRVDINTMPPQVDEASWRLELGGLVDRPLSLSLADLRSRPAVSQVITLSCISNPLGGDLISTALWTGVRLKDLLEEAGLQPNAQEVSIEAADGFYESVSREDMQDERTLLVYAMNGAPLPVEHGFPLRIYIPNHYGMKQPKWITRMEVIDHPGAGYWVDRGWNETAIPQTTSVVDAVVPTGEGPDIEQVAVGGIAYAGARGISKVEVQVDDGPWQAAELRTPPLSPLTWVQWRYFWPARAGRHTFRVRAYDGSGKLQPVEKADPHPNGATGIHSKAEVIPGG